MDASTAQHRHTLGGQGEVLRGVAPAGGVPPLPAEEADEETPAEGTAATSDKPAYSQFRIDIITTTYFPGTQKSSMFEVRTAPGAVQTPKNNNLRVPKNRVS